MKILLLGAGGREHALALKISESEQCSELYVAPGNAGTNQCATNVELNVNDFTAIKAFCVSKKIDMVVVGPEEPLVKGVVDSFASDSKVKHIPVIGPDKSGAQLEGSKAFAKAFMQKNNIPTAEYREFDHANYADGVTYLKNHSLPIVLKADGLAAGKGVLICQSHLEAVAEFELMIQESKFGEASKKVVVEAFLDGIELSVFVLTDGKNYVILPEAKDYKRAEEGDKGPNTGGMGAISPVPFADNAFMQKVKTQIIDPTIQGLQKEKINYKGFIFFGLIKVDGEPFVIEYNCRMGDPETEVVIPRLKTDLVHLLNATAKGELNTIQIETDPRNAATVVAVSGGYPGEYQKGLVIEGLETIMEEDTTIFHAGTIEKDHEILTNGGRVLAATSFGETIQQAVEKSNAVLGIIYFEGMNHRNDIGYEFYQ